VSFHPTHLVQKNQLKSQKQQDQRKHPNVRGSQEGKNQFLFVITGTVFSYLSFSFSDKISFARWRWGKQVLAKDGSVIAIEEETDGVPVLRSTQCLEHLVIRNTGRPSTMCRKCYEINRTLQYGLRDMKRGKLGKKKVFSPDTLLPVDC